MTETEAACPGFPSAAALGSSMSSSYATAISALSSDGPVNPPAKPVHEPPQAHARSLEPLGSFEEQQENPADYGVGEHSLHENATVETSGF